MSVEERKNSLKLSLLIITLVIPVAIYLFLRAFGENHYIVPVYYEQGVNKDTIECHFGNTQHVVRVVNLFQNEQKQVVDDIFDHKITVVDIDYTDQKGMREIGNSLNRVTDAFSGINFFQILVIRPDVITQQVKQNTSDNGLKYINTNRKEISNFAECQLILLDFTVTETSSWNKRFVLIDQKGRIRGYYYANDFEEIDRLILEIKIILEEEF